VAAAASSLGNIDNLVVLNGAEGMEDMLGKAMTMGGAGLGLAQKLMASIRADNPTKAGASAETPSVAELKPVQGKLAAKGKADDAAGKVDPVKV